MNDDVVLLTEILLVAAMVAFFLAIAALVAACVFLYRCRQKLRRLNQAPTWDANGRPFKERL